MILTAIHSYNKITCNNTCYNINAFSFACGEGKHHDTYNIGYDYGMADKAKYAEKTENERIYNNLFTSTNVIVSRTGI